MKIYFSKPDIKLKALDYIKGSIKSRWITSGPLTEKFENQICKKLNAQNCLCVNSCTSALILSLNALGIKQKDEVIVPVFTFAATANAVEEIGAIPVFCDIDKLTYNIDINKIEKRITKNTKAIIAVDYAGLPCEYDKILKLCRKYRLKLIIDAAHSFGAKYNGKFITEIGADAVCFSFYATKNLTTGEGGAVCFKNKNIYLKAKMLRLHGLGLNAERRYNQLCLKDYEVIDLGYKFNFNDILAGIGLYNLERFDKMQERRNKIWDKYIDVLKNIKDIQLPLKEYKKSQSAMHLFTILLKDKQMKQNLRNYLMEKGIQTSVHFKPLHLHKYYRNKYKYKRGDFPAAEDIYERILSLPFSSALKNKEINYIIKELKHFFQGRAFKWLF